MNLSRRKFLGGAGALVALPFLEALQPRAARAAAAAATPKRFITFYFPCGRIPSTWVPSATGSNFTFPSATASLAPVQKYVNFLSGISNSQAFKATGVGAHASATGGLLAGVPVTTGQSFNLGTTVDQIIAKSLPSTTRFSSLQWTSGAATVCDVGASCTYTQCISWLDARTPMAPIADPLAAYNQLFAGADPGATATEQALRSTATKSVLDYVLQDGNRFISTLGSADRTRMDEYFTSVRSLENSLFAPASANCDPGSAPQSGPDYQTSVKVFSDMMTMALQCNLTQVITYMIEFDISYRAHPFVNAPLGHHALTHTGTQDAATQLTAVETWEAQQLAYLVTKLQNTQDANGASLLDSTVILATPAMGLGGAHDNNNLAPMLIGSCGGYFKTGGQHLDFGNNQHFNNVLVSLQEAMGVQSSMFGGDTGPIPGIAA